MQNTSDVWKLNFFILKNCVIVLYFLGHLSIHNLLQIYQITFCHIVKGPFYLQKLKFTFLNVIIYLNFQLNQITLNPILVKLLIF